MLRYSKLVWFVLLMVVASFGFGGFGQGGGCMGTQSQVRMVGGSSGQFVLLTPANGVTTGSQPTFSWAAFPVDLTSYTLQISTNAYFTGTLTFQNTNISRNATAFQIGATTLQPNTTYFWRVIAVDRDTGTSTTASNAPFSFNTGITPGQFNLLSPIPPSETIYTTTPTLIWSESAQAASYNVQIDTENTFNDPLIYQVDLAVTTTYQVPSGRLTNGVTYYWRVRAVNTGGTTTAANAPASYYVVGAPGSFLLSAPAISSTQQTITPTLSWTGATQATTYRVEISLNTSYVPTVLSYGGITDTSFSIPAGVLQNGYTYYWRTVAVNVVGETVSTNNVPPYSFTIDVSPQSFNQSSPISASVIASLTPTFTWSTSSLATEYTLEVSSLSTFASVMVFPTIISTTYTLPAGRLSDNQTYWWRVIANNTTGVTRTASNAPLSFRTDVAPRAFTLSSVISGTTVDTLTPTFAWTTADLASEYTLQLSTDVNFNSFASIVGITTTSYTVSGGLVNGQGYWWRVIAISNDTPITTTAANAPYRFFVNVGPRNFTLTTPVTETVFTVVSPTFTWSNSDRATAYTLQVATNNTFTILVYENVSIPINSFTLPSGILATGQSYWWRVFATNEYTTDSTRLMAYNAPLIFSVNVTPGSFSLSMPISGTVLGSLMPTLQWGPSNLATTYYLQIDDDSAFTEPYRYENRGITSTSFTVPANALEMGTTYWWRVRGVNDYGQTLASNAPYAFTPTTAPLSFYLVSPNNDSIIQDSLSPTFTWTTSLYATTYTLQISTVLSFATLVYENSTITSTTESFRLADGVLETARQYYWRIVSSNDQGQGQTIAGNGPFNFTTQVYPTAFSLLEPQNGVITYTLTPVFTWSPSTILTSYTFQMDTESTFAPPLSYESTTISSTNAITIPGGTLTGNISYYWRVIARNASGTTTATGSPFQFTAGAPPGTFTLETPISGTVEVSLTPTLTWVLAANATGYTIVIDEEPTFTLPIVYQAIVGITNTYNVPAQILSSRRVYYWRVIAGNDFGSTIATNIAPYETVSYSVFDTFVPSTPPDAFNLTVPSNESVVDSYVPTLIWNDSVGEEKYTLEIVTDTSYFALNLFVYTQTDIARNSTSISLPIGALPDIGRYYWRIIASNAYGNTIASNAPFAMIIDSTTSPWKPISVDSFSMFMGRRGHTAVWTGSEMLIWGGYAESGSEVTYFRDGVRYNPTESTWDYINDIGAPSTRTGHTAVWTGSEMIIWGGRNSGTNFFNDGARYDPANDTWTALGDSFNAPTARAQHTAVWSSSLQRMIVWGGYTYRSEYTDWIYLNSGGIYYLSGDTWSPTAASSTNSYYILQNYWNGYQWYLQPFYFDRTISAPEARGSEIIPVGGGDIVSPLSGHTAVWDEVNLRMVVWGGINTSGNTMNTGGYYYPSENRWFEFTYPAANIPASRTGHTAIWSGSEMYIFGGNQGGSIFYPVNTGTLLTSYDGRYSFCYPRNYVLSVEAPTYRSIYNDSWNTFPGIYCPSSRTGHTGIWTGTQMIIWGGYNGSELNTGGIFRPIGNSWYPMSIISAPSGREGHTAVWTGTEMIVWGGENNDGFLDNGGIYNPFTDSWRELPAMLVGPSGTAGREFHTMIFSDYDWQEPVLDKDLATPPATPEVDDRYLVAPAGAAGLWTGQENNLTIWDGSQWLFAVPVLGMYVTVKDENIVYKYDGANWVATTAIPQVIIWGGWNGSQAFRNGIRYNAVEDNWTILGSYNAPTARYGHTAVWSNPITSTITPTMIAWGGFDGSSYSNTGGLYDPTVGWGGLWTTLPTTTLSPRAWHSAVWAYDGPNDSNEMIVCGGYDGFNYYNDGAIYEVTSNAWYPMTSTNRPNVRMNHTAIWANTITPMSMVVWGGLSSSNNRLNTGGRYIPISDTWLSTSTPPPGFVGRDGHSAVWTGTGSEEGWTTYSTVTNNNVGLNTSIVLSPSGRAHVAYYDNTYNDLKYTTNESGLWDSTGVSVDTVGSVGKYASIAMDSNGYLHISYYDQTNGNLRYATNLSGTWQTDTLDSAGFVGLYTDIAIGAGNLVHISYYDDSNSALKYINGVTGSWNAPVTVASAGLVGKYNSLAVDNVNKAYISYYDETNGNLNYATVTGGVPTVTPVDTAAADVGLYSSIGLDSAKNVYISYYDMTNGRLKFVSDITGAFVVEGQPDSAATEDHGEYSSLAVNTVTTPTVHISYYDKTLMRLKYISKSSVYTTTWDAPVVIDESGDVGQYSNITTDQSKKSYISYYDNVSGDLKYATNSWIWRNKMLIWGGYDGVNYLNSGAMYDPVTDSWRNISTLNAPSNRAYHSAVWCEWTDWQGRNRSELVVWGGWNGSGYLNDGAQYNPALDTWTTINSLGAPSARTYHRGLWMDFVRPDNNRTVREMIIWGGAVNSGFTQSGSRYKP